MSAKSCSARRLLALALLTPLLIPACSRTTAAVASAGAAAAAVIAYNDRGATTTVNTGVPQLADATEAAFQDLGIVLTERSNQSDGIELKGAEGEWKVVVDIERDADEPVSDVEVSVSKDQINYEKSRAEEILRAILRRAD